MAVKRERLRVDVPGGTIAVTAAGAGPAVVLLHGLGLDSSIWDVQLDALAGRQHVLAMDQRGHGHSSPADAPYARHDDVISVLDELGIAQAALVGSSMGGEVALDTALAFPARVRSLVLFSPSLGGYDWSPAWRDSIRAIRVLARADGAEAAKQAWFEHPLFAAVRAHEAARARLHDGILADSGRRWRERDPAVPLDPPAAMRLAEVRCPTTILVGEDDLADFHTIADALCAGIAHARFHGLVGGHLPMLESPARTADHLGKILEGLPPRA